MNNELKIRLALDGQQAVASGLQSVGTQLQGVGTSAGQAVQGSDNLSAALGRVAHYGLAGGGLYALVQSARAVGAALFESSASAQRLATQMNFATDGRGAQELAFVSGVAHDLGLELKTTAQAYAGFASAARGTALQGSGARDVFEAMSKASAVMGLSADQASGALLAVQQMMSKGTVSAEEFRGQLGERMPIALQAGAKALGVTTAEFNKMMESGQIVAEDFLPKFAQAMTEMLGNSAEEAASRLDAATARMGNAWERLKKTAGDSGISRTMATEADALGGYFQALSDSMDRAKASGAGMVGQLSNGLGYMIARAPFDALSGSANLLNGTINVLTGGVLGLNTNINLLPDSMRTSASQTALLDGRIKEANASFADLQARAQADPGNIYIKNDMARLSQYIGQLQEAKRQKDALEDRNPTAEGVRASGMARERYLQQQAKDKESLAALQMKVSGVPDSYVKDMTEIIRLNEAGVLVGKAYTDMLAAQQTALLKKTQATGAGKSAQDELNKAVERGVKTYGDLIAQESGLNADFAEKWKDLAAAFGKGKLSADQLLQAQQALLALQPAIKKAAEDRIKAENDAFDEAMKRQDADNAATEARIKTGRTMLDQIEFETKLLGLNATEREMATAMRELERQGVVQGTEAWAAYADKVREAISGREAIKANLEGMKANTAAAEKMADKIESSITDALMRGFESGKGLAQNLRDTFSNMFKTLVLRPQIQGVVTGGLGALGLGAPGAAAADTGLGGMVSSGINALGLTGVGAAFGSTLATGFVSTLTGSMAPALTAAGSMIGTGTATSIASGMGLAVGAVAPYVLAVAAVAALAKKLDTSGTIHTGGSASYSAAAGVQTGLSQARTGFAYTDRRAETETMAAGVAQSIVGLLDSTATAFGKTAGYTAATAFADDSSRDGAWGSLVLSKAGKDVLNWGDNRQSRWAPKEFASGEDGVKQYMAAVGKDVRDMLIAETPAWADAMLQALGDAPTLEQLGAAVQQITAIQGLFTKFGEAMPQLRGLSDEAVGSLMQLAGGVGNLQQGLSTYMDLFYSEAEKQAAATKSVADAMAGLGLAMPATNAQFRQLVEAQDLTSEAGRQTYASLIALSPAFAQVATQSGAAAEAIQAIGRSAADIAQEARGLQDQLDQLTLTSVQLREKERAALDESNRALYDQISALQDGKAAAEEAAQAQQAAAQAQDAIAQEAQGLQNQLDQLTGNTAVLRERERSALDESNRALYDQVQALQAQKTATEAAAQAASAAAQQRAGLQDQLDQLTGNTAALRERERAAISDGNKGLYDQILAIKDQQAADAAREQAAKEMAAAAASAAQESARAAEQVRSAWMGIGQSISDEIDRIRGVVNAGGAVSLSAAQAQFAVATAQARAGDQDAAKSLPALSKAMLDVAGISATSALELRRIQGQTAGVLAQTLAAITGKPTLPAGAVTAASTGTGLGTVSAVEPVYSAGFAPQLSPMPSMQQGAAQADPNAALVSEIQQLRAQVARLEQSSSATANNTLKTKDVLVQVTRDGNAMRTQAAA